MTGHQFVRPGQIGPGRLAPDACMVCGQPETAHRPGPLGPFETSGAASLAVRPDDDSFISPQQCLNLLTDTMSAAGVNLGRWDWVVLRWLANLDAPTVAAIAGWVQRARLIGGQP